MIARALLRAACVAALVCTGWPARAAVRVETDEVIFSLKSPGAHEVFVMGDFNRWNPTVEKLELNGDVFEVRLFLVAGEYRYKFVVDGQPVVDPDNPGPADRGSPLKLVERSGGLMLDADAATPTGAAPVASGWLRYIGRASGEDGEHEGDQRVDAEVRGRYEKLFARARFATLDSAWTDAFFDRGRVRVDVGRLAMTGFENDSTWASGDPMQLIGNAGVFGYDAGFGRHGASAEARGKHAGIALTWADATGRDSAPLPALDDAAAQAFTGGTAADTSLYAYRAAYHDADMLAFEGSLQFDELSLGYTHRSEDGLNPGLLGEIERDGPEFVTTLTTTREDRRVGDAWLKQRLAGLTLFGGFGWGNARVQAVTREGSVAQPPLDLDPSAAASPADASEPLLETQRGALAVSRPGQTAWSLGWDGVWFDFSGVEGESSADVQRVHASGTLTRAAWSVGATVDYARAEYGRTPDALYIDTPERNPWLSLYDDVDAASMVGVGLEEHEVVTVDGAWWHAGTSANATLIAQSGGVFERLVHTSLHASLGQRFRERWVARVDARGAWYADPTPGRDDTYFSGYLETGYSHDGVELNLGFGFDPRVFDPVVGDYAEIGYTSFLRRAVAGGIRRSDADGIRDRLLQQEARLRDSVAIKLECIIELE